MADTVFGEYAEFTTHLPAHIEGDEPVAPEDSVAEAAPIA